MNVFLVDGSSILRQRLRRMLANLSGIQVVGEAGQVQVARDAIVRQKPDVVLMDIDLSDGNGIALLQSIKKTELVPRVIILTDDFYPPYRQKCIEAGADFFFIKSMQFDLIIPALRQLDQRARDLNAGPSPIW